MSEVTQDDLKLILKKLAAVKQAGFGEVLIRVTSGVIVYVETKIGEQVKK
jgi:hypothetical protein